MGTHGLFGFRYKKKYYMVYNTFDSYYCGLGQKLLNELREMVKNGQFEEWLQLFLNIKIVFESMKASEDDIKTISEYTKSEYNIKHINDFYHLLHDCQGSYVKCLKSGYLLINEDIINNNDEIDCDSWQEYAYIVDLNNKKFIIFSRHGSKRIYYLDNLPKHIDEDVEDNDDSSVYSEGGPFIPN